MFAYIHDALVTLAGKPAFGGASLLSVSTTESRCQPGNTSVSHDGVCMPACRAQAAPR